jgi:hypothetical protein
LSILPLVARRSYRSSKALSIQDKYRR